MQAMSGARLVELMGPTGEPANVVVFVFACGLMMLNLTQLRMAFDMDVSKSTTHNQMAAYKVAHPSDWPDTYATKQQRAFARPTRFQAPPEHPCSSLSNWTTSLASVKPKHPLGAFCCHSFGFSMWQGLPP